VAVTLLAFAALAATLIASLLLTIRRSEPTAWAYACYWAIAAVLIGLAYWFTNQGTGVGAGGGGVNYVLIMAPAAGVGVALLAAGSSSGRIAVSLAIAAVGSVNIASIANGRAEEHGDAQRYGPELIRLLEREG
jgi:hypothetical protein